MVKSINIVMNHRGSVNTGSVRIPFLALGNALRQLPMVNLHINDYENYRKYDVAIFHTDDDDIFSARNDNPNLIIGLVKPHHERRIEPLFNSLKLRSLVYQSRLFFNDKLYPYIKKRNEKLKASDFLIADTIDLRNKFEFEGYKSIYLKLVEEFPEGLTPDNGLSEKSENSIYFGYHGNYRHLLESKSYIFPALNKLNEKYNVKLKVVTNLDHVQKKLGNEFDIEMFEYSYPEIYDFLSDVDIGLVPNNIPYRGRISKFLIYDAGCYLWITDRKHDMQLRFKESANAGRAYIFAQLNIPFISCPVPEVSSVFGGFMPDCIPVGEKSWYMSIIKLANNKKRRLEISKKLNKLVFMELSPKFEALKLVKYIQKEFYENK
ncbi:hypothetical protein CZ809_00425 [Photobacterium piscicola]|uniref:Glycosyltransferase family 1 protein n=1 Tax=Photobacterium piscicola TaxID=1378299 RepID=A0A1T5HVT3_9GAMM|nr:hypothetical protein [Photobacterium piscicola]SKC30948.1 hypothetical protein CZ809_00425 [Photobacterium piscicola]